MKDCGAGDLFFLIGYSNLSKTDSKQWLFVVIFLDRLPNNLLLEVPVLAAAV